MPGTLTDRGPELGIHHHRAPPRSPNHSAVCERFHGTVLHELFRVAFHRESFVAVDQLDRQLQTWVEHDNPWHRKRSDDMRGRSPLQILNTHRGNHAARRPPRPGRVRLSPRPLARKS